MPIKSLLFAFLATILFIACSSPEKQFESFEAELKAGNLSKAEAILGGISKRRLKERGALKLIKTYIDVDQADMAINVYENITPNHKGRHALTDYFTKSDDYDLVVCKLLRTYLVRHGEYDMAWRYYPLKYSSEDYGGNAECRYQYMVDVVNDMCLKGRFDAARRFVDVQASWFAVHVDNSEDADKSLSAFTSDNVRQELYEQIDRLSY